MVFRIADNGNPPAAGDYYIPFRHTLRGIVSSFRMNVRTQQANKLGDVWRVENGNGVHVTEGCKKLRPFIARNAWPAFSLKNAGAGI